MNNSLEPLPPSAPSPVPTQLSTHPPAHLLVVDDDLLLRSLAVKALKHAGFDVSDASTGEDALQRFAERTYALVLLDVMMPGMDGYEVCQRIRAQAHGARVPILMLTGLNDTDSIEQAYRHGATDFITKPINWTLLSHRVRYALRASMATEAMRRNSETLARAQSMARMGTWQAIKKGELIFSEQLVSLFMMPPEVVQTATAEFILGRVVPADRDRVRAARALLAAEGTHYELEFQLERFDGAIRTVFEQGSLRLDDNATPIGMEGITQDITERVQAQEKIRLLANYDPTTGLPNQQFFAELANTPIERARRYGTTCALVHMDIDRFKGVNDAFGRAQGDAVLRTLVERLRLWTRSSDLASVGLPQVDHGVLARVGSNAFTLLIMDLRGQQHAAVVAQRLLNAISQPIEMAQQQLVLTASIGIALFPNDATDLPTLARFAEQALYAAKVAGRAQHRFFNEAMNALATNRVLVEADLRRAVAAGELCLHFQPKVDAQSGAIVGAEALVRWQHPERGLVPPGEFIPLAEETGLILPLTDWVLESACTSLRAWLDAGLPPVPLSVNLAAPSLTDGTLIGKLDALMHHLDLAPASLILEVTETMLMRDVEHAVTLLETLRTKGYGVSLDDFGTGYSSLSYLKRLPMDELKIDRSFVNECASGGRDSALAGAIIALGLELGLRVVAEGVETPEQTAFLLRHGCVLQQGFLFSRPVPAPQFEQLLRQGFTRLLSNK